MQEIVALSPANGEQLGEKLNPDLEEISPSCHRLPSFCRTPDIHSHCNAVLHTLAQNSPSIRATLGLWSSYICFYPLRTWNNAGKNNKNNNNKTETQKMGRRIVLSFKKGNAKPLQLSVPISSSPLNQS